METLLPAAVADMRTQWSVEKEVRGDRGTLLVVSGQCLMVSGQRRPGTVTNGQGPLPVVSSRWPVAGDQWRCHCPTDPHYGSRQRLATPTALPTAYSLTLLVKGRVCSRR